jgi:hypothetical protein
MNREWAPEVPDARKRQILLAAIERGEAAVEETKAAMDAAEKKAKPYVDRARDASRRHYSAREQLRDDRADLKELVTDPDPDSESMVAGRTKR